VLILAHLAPGVTQFEMLLTVRPEDLMCRFACAMMILLAASVAGAKEPTSAPTTKPAGWIVAVHNADDARNHFDVVLRIARIQHVHDLNDLKTRAVKADNLAEANALAGIIAQVEHEQRGKSGPSKNARFARAAIQAKDDWTRTIPVKKGDVLNITAVGQWCTNNRIPAETTYGPDGLRADGTAEVHGQWSVLIARIGFKGYLVGKEAQIVAPQDGFLEMRSNDCNLEDNTGAINVTIAKDSAG
jgi:hypothetical protein